MVKCREISGFGGGWLESGRGGGGAPSGLAPSWECCAAQSRQACRRGGAGAELGHCQGVTLTKQVRAHCTHTARIQHACSTHEAALCLRCIIQHAGGWHACPYVQYGGPIMGVRVGTEARAFCSSSVRGSGLISRTAAVAEVETTLMLPASNAAEIEMAVENAVPTTPESMAGSR
eukprot:scaffold59088_cov26-Phaeocystis_antarctica.AAC.1